MIGQKIILKAVDHRDEFIKRFPVSGPIHQQLFRPEHFRDFAEHDIRAVAGQKIGEPPQQRIGSDPGIAIGTAAFQTEGEFAEIAGFALIMAHDLINLLEQLHGAVNLIFNVLAVQAADALRIDLFQRVVKRFQLIVFTAQTKHEHAPGIGMGDDVL